MISRSTIHFFPSIIAAHKILSPLHASEDALSLQQKHSHFHGEDQVLAWSIWWAQPFSTKQPVKQDSITKCKLSMSVTLYKSSLARKPCFNGENIEGRIVFTWNNGSIQFQSSNHVSLWILRNPTNDPDMRRFRGVDRPSTPNKPWNPPVYYGCPPRNARTCQIKQEGCLVAMIGGGLEIE